MVKSTKENQSGSFVDTMIWLLITCSLLGAIAGNYLYADGVSVYLRAAGWIVLLIVLLGLALMTEKGKTALSFSKDARGEMRKVHWPSRHETVQTTLMVIVMVVLVGLMLWAVDSLFMWAVNWLTGQRG